MALTRINNELYIDFDLLAKVYAERFKRGLTFHRLNHSHYVKLCQDATLNEHLNDLERTENRKLNCLNFKKR